MPTISYNYVPQPRPDVRSTANVLKGIFMMSYSARYPSVRRLPVFVERVLAFYSYVFMISEYERDCQKPCGDKTVVQGLTQVKREANRLTTFS